MSLSSEIMMMAAQILWMAACVKTVQTEIKYDNKLMYIVNCRFVPRPVASVSIVLEETFHIPSPYSSQFAHCMRDAVAISSSKKTESATERD
jgi:hypothetical protein